VTVVARPWSRPATCQVTHKAILPASRIRSATRDIRKGPVISTRPPTACFYKIDAGTPTAAATDAYLPAPWVEYVKVSPGQKISIYSPTVQTVSVIEVGA
jgi:hypothetical protein